MQENEIKDSVAKYLPQISDILNRVPRQMLLLFKTNDLLRGIETTLDTRANASSFIAMSLCCVHALYAKKRRHVSSRLHYVVLYVEEYWRVFQIRCYAWYLWLVGCKDQFLKNKLKSDLTEHLKTDATQYAKKQKQKLATAKTKAKQKVKEQKERTKDKFKETKQSIADKNSIFGATSSSDDRQDNPL